MKPATMSESEFQYITVLTAGECVVLTITEQRLDNELVTAALSRELLAAVVTGPAKVILNLRNVKMMHTYALQMLLDLRKKVRERQGRVVLCGLSVTVTEILRITAFIDPGRSPDAFFETAPDVNAAIAQLNAAKP